VEEGRGWSTCAQEGRGSDAGKGTKAAEAAADRALAV
jgi:hypothetical protein